VTAAGLKGKGKGKGPAACFEATVTVPANYPEAPPTVRLARKSEPSPASPASPASPDGGSDGGPKAAEAVDEDLAAIAAAVNARCDELVGPFSPAATNGGGGSGGSEGSCDGELPWDWLLPHTLRRVQGCLDGLPPTAATTATAATATTATSTKAHKSFGLAPAFAAKQGRRCKPAFNAPAEAFFHL
jgi:hypothetical protein